MKQYCAILLLIVALTNGTTTCFAHNQSLKSEQESNSLDFLNQSFNIPLAEFCRAIHQAGFTYYGEIETCATFLGTINGVGNTHINVSAIDNRQAIDYVLINFPSGHHWSDSESDYSILRNQYYKLYGSPYSETNEPRCTWVLKEKEQTLSIIEWKHDHAIVMYLNVSQEKQQRTKLPLDTIPSGKYSYEQVLAKAKEGMRYANAWDSAQIPEIGDKAEKSLLEGIHMLSEMYEQGQRRDTSILSFMASLYSQIGGIYGDRSQLYKALEYFEKSLSLIDQLPEHTAESDGYILNNLGKTYSEIGDYTKAEKYYLQAITKKMSIKRPADDFKPLRSLALVYQYSGKYKEAEETYAKCLQLLSDIGQSKSSEDYLVVLQDMATLAILQGDYAKASQLIKEGLSLLQNEKAMPNHLYGICYGIMANIDFEEKKYQESILHLHMALANNVGNNKRELDIYKSIAYDNLSICYSEINQQDSAIYYARKATDLIHSALSDKHPKYAVSLSNLAYAYHKQQDYTNALKYYREALPLLEQSVGKVDLNTMHCIYNLASTYAAMNNYRNAERNYKEAVEIAKLSYQQAVEYMSEHQRALYWTRIQNILQRPEMARYIYSTYASIPSICGFAYDNELFNKGLLLISSNIVTRSILLSKDQQLIDLYNDLKTLKGTLTYLESAGLYPRDIESLNHRADSLEKEITKRSAIYRQNEELWKMDWHKVQQHLRKGDVAIEFNKMPLSSDSTMYCALLLRHNSSHPELIPLFEEKEVQSLLQIGNPSLINRTYTHDGYGQALAQLIWGKILPYVQKGEAIYFAPAGILHQVAMEALPYDKTHSMYDVFNMVRMSSTREVVMRNNASTPVTASLYGGILYNLSGKEMAVADGGLTRAEAVYLPGTKTEVEQISQLLQDNHLKTRLYTAANANEESFKALSGQHQNILHLATHGFYWAEDVAQRKDYFMQRARLGNETAITDIDPLTRCGLLLAGANTAWTGHVQDLPEGVQDGILTAKEISLLDLRDAEMVVLSACETGKGEITGEGVFGLQRAFKQAGAQTIIMSLWPVSDEATQLLMSEFYRNWIALRQTKRQAFRNAQNHVREEYALPVFWAGFIMLD